MSAENLAEAIQHTIEYYNRNAERFWEGTKDHDVEQNRMALLRNLWGVPPFRILDLGCGPGRDLKAFRDLGHEAVGVDGALRFCEMARAYSGCEVLQQNMLALSLEAASVHGVFANASLFHVPSQALPAVLRHLWQALKDNGVLLASNPRGNNEEGLQSDRYGVYYEESRWIETVTAAGFELVEQYDRPSGKPRHQQPWFVTLFRKTLAP